MIESSIKGLEALPSPGFYIRYRRRPSLRRQSEREQRNILKHIFNDLESFSLDGHVAKLSRDLQLMSGAVLRRFVEHEGVAKLDPRLESFYRGNPKAKRLHLIEKRIGEIRVEAAAPNELEPSRDAQTPRRWRERG